MLVDHGHVRRDSGDEPDEDDEDEEDRRRRVREPRAEQQTKPAGDSPKPRKAAEMEQARPGEMDARDATFRRRDGGRGEGCRHRGARWRSARPALSSTSCPASTTRSIPPNSTRPSRPRNCATPPNWTPARLPRQAARQSAGRGRAPRQPAAAPPDGPAEPVLGLRPRGRLLDAARLPRIVIDPMHAAVLQARAATPLPRHRRHAAARQFRLHARPARSPSPPPAPTSSPARSSAAASRSRSSASPPAPGRADSRAKPGCCRQARPIRAASTTCATSSTNRRRAVAPGAAQSRPDDARRPAEGKHRRRGPDLGPQPAARPPEQRRILMMISDGAPVDDSTLSVNPATISNGTCAVIEESRRVRRSS
jgi:hypothetical protein